MLERLDDAAKLTGVDPDIHRLLRTPERILEVAVPVRMDDGRVEVFTGWRVHHDTTRGPAKGGIRFHPDLDAREVAALAANMTFKTAVANLSIGGTRGHAGATATGVLLCARAAFVELDLPFVGSRAVVQGFGKVGGPLVFLLSSAGMRVVAVSDIGGAVYSAGGLDPSALSD